MSAADQPLFVKLDRIAEELSDRPIVRDALFEVAKELEEIEGKDGASVALLKAAAGTSDFLVSLSESAREVEAERLSIELAGAAEVLDEARHGHPAEEEIQRADELRKLGGRS